MTLPFWPRLSNRRHARKLSGKGNTKNYYQISLNLLGRLCKVITGQLNNLNLLGSECRASVSNYSKSACNYLTLTLIVSRPELV